MKKCLCIFLLVFLQVGFANPKKNKEVKQVKKNPIVLFQTSHGEFQVELFKEKAPLTVGNFLRYVNSGFYNGTLFHRIIDGFMIQGGGFDKELKKKGTFAPVKNEATNRISNSRGTIAMARTGEVNSATAQFFINVKDNSFLDHKGTDPQSFGYAVFGRIIKGMPVINRIKTLKIAQKGKFKNFPVDLVFMRTVKVLK